MQAFVERFGKPNQYDQFPYGTLCKVRDGERFDFYRQISEDQTVPHWSLVEFPDIGLFED